MNVSKVYNLDVLYFLSLVHVRPRVETVKLIAIKDEDSEPHPKEPRPRVQNEAGNGESKKKRRSQTTDKAPLKSSKKRAREMGSDEEAGHEHGAPTPKKARSSSGRESCTEQKNDKPVLKACHPIPLMLTSSAPVCTSYVPVLRKRLRATRLAKELICPSENISTSAGVKQCDAPVINFAQEVHHEILDLKSI